MSDMIGRVLMYYPAFLFALCFHEYAHGWVARRKGDNTAEVMGRLTMNPLSHADPLGTVVLPIAALATGLPFFGWAKPVPVNERNLKHPRNDMFWVALAGPLSNILLGSVAVLGLVFADRYGATGGLKELLKMFLIINLFLAVFNLIPLHPLDGGKVLARFLPDKTNYWLENNQQMSGMILIGLMLIGGFKFLSIPVMILAETLYSLAHSFASVFPV